MEIESGMSGAICVVKPAGRLDAATTGQLEETLLALAANDAACILLDLSALTYISSAGLRTILFTAKKLKASRGKLHLCGLAGMVEEVFRLAGFYDLLLVFDSRQEALDRF